MTRRRSTYEFVLSPTGGHVGIKCRVCGAISWNLNDVLYGYCARCHQFHDLLIDTSDLR